MNEDGALVPLMVGVLVVAISAAGGVIQPLRGDPRTPMPRVGRLPAEIAAGVGPGLIEVEPEAPGLSATRMEALRAPLAAVPWPSFAKGVVVHLFRAGLPAADLEEGSPWHLVLARNGVIEVGPRYRGARPSRPKGAPPATAVSRVHLAIPGVRDGDGLDRAVCAVLLEELRRRSRNPDLPIEVVAHDPSLQGLATQFTASVRGKKER